VRASAIRRAAAALGACLAAALLAGCGLFSCGSTGNVGELDFRNRLRIPPLLEGRMDISGRRVFDLRMQTGRTELLAGHEAETWGIDGPYLAPTLRAEPGDTVAFRVRNALPETSTLHWHGMHLPARADGGPHQMIEPGSEWRPSWTIAQPAATLWYHPHQMGETEDQVYRGLFGMFIVGDDPAGPPGLPNRYGVDDIPLIVQDVRLSEDGQLDFSQAMVSPIGRLGDEILVNGTHDPHLEVRSEATRLRLLNASTARIYDFGFSDRRAFDLVAGDGGLLERPARTRRVLLSPGERAEIVVRMEPGERTVLRSFEPDLDGVDFFNARFVGGDDSFDVLQLRAAEELAAFPPLPSRLLEHDESPPPPTGEPRRFELSSSTAINGVSMDMDRIDEVVEAGTSELWEVHNPTGIPHNFHVHGVGFSVLEVDGQLPPPPLSGPKDTVLVLPDQTVRLLVGSPGYADPARPFMFHCHLLEHEDRGMMGQFTVVEPGSSAR